MMEPTSSLVHLKNIQKRLDYIKFLPRKWRFPMTLNPKFLRFRKKCHLSMFQSIPNRSKTLRRTPKSPFRNLDNGWGIWCEDGHYYDGYYTERHNFAYLRCFSSRRCDVLEVRLTPRFRRASVCFVLSPCTAIINVFVYIAG